MNSANQEENGPVTRSWKDMTAKLHDSKMRQALTPIVFECPENQGTGLGKQFSNIDLETCGDVYLPSTSASAYSTMQLLGYLYSIFTTLDANLLLNKTGFMAGKTWRESLQLLWGSQHVNRCEAKPAPAWPDQDDEMLQHSKIDVGSTTLENNFLAEPSRSESRKASAACIRAKSGRSCEDSRQKAPTRKRLVLVHNASEPRSGMTHSDLVAPSLDNQAMNAVTCPEWMWNQGQTIVVCFLDGTQKQHNFVMQCFGEYDVNLTFDFVDAGQRERSHVRITFQGEGFHSVVGTQALDFDKNDATMSLSLKNWHESLKLRGKILREGLHILAFDHEQSSPNCPIKWIPSEVYQYYKKMYYWNFETTRRNVLYRHQAHEVTASKYDPESIMHYEVDSSLTQDGFSVFPRNELSKMDKKRQKWMYGSRPQISLHAASQSPAPLATTSSLLPPLALASQSSPLSTITFQLLTKQIIIIGLCSFLICLVSLVAWRGGQLT